MRFETEELPDPQPSIKKHSRFTSKEGLRYVVVYTQTEYLDQSIYDQSKEVKERIIAMFQEEFMAREFIKKVFSAIPAKDSIKVEKIT